MVTKRTILATTLALVLAACGGGGGSDGTGSTGGTGGTGGSGGTGGVGGSGGTGGTGGNTPTPSKGIFLDSAVAGIHYETATQSGETDAEGRFNYLPGETVTFSIGGIVLPAVAASDTVTPLMVFETNDFTDQRVVNLGRLLQSLDDDGDLENGIQVTAEARSAATGVAIDLNVPAGTFETNTQVINLLAAGGGSPTLVSEEDAIAHMQEQAGKNGLSIVGTWYVNEGSEFVVTVTFLADGHYMLVEDGEDGDESGGPGVEYGTYTWDPVSGDLAATVTTDTNGEWGLSHPMGQMNVARDGDTIVFSESGDTEGPTTLARLVADPDNALVGTWIVDGQADDTISVFAFLPDGHYLLGETGEEDEAGEPGIEHGTYAWNAQTFAFTLEEIINETNGDWGIGSDAPLTVQIDGDTLTATFGEGEEVTLTRQP